MNGLLIRISVVLWIGIKVIPLIVFFLLIFSLGADDALTWFLNLSNVSISAAGLEVRNVLK